MMTTFIEVILLMVCVILYSVPIVKLKLQRSCGTPLIQNTSLRMLLTWNSWLATLITIKWLIQHCSLNNIMNSFSFWFNSNFTKRIWMNPLLCHVWLKNFHHHGNTSNITWNIKRRNFLWFNLLVLFALKNPSVLKRVKKNKGKFESGQCQFMWLKTKPRNLNNKGHGKHKQEYVPNNSNKNKKGLVYRRCSRWDIASVYFMWI